MSEHDMRQATTGLATQETTVSAVALDEAGAGKETEWTNPYWEEYHGYYETIPEVNQSANSLADWTCGRGWTADQTTTLMLELISGSGEDSFDSIMKDVIVTKKINGDAYMEIVRDGPVILNLKPLNPSRCKTVFDERGIISKYRVMQGDGTWKDMKRKDIFHVMNRKRANQIHGTSIITSAKQDILALKEAKADYKKLLHRSTIRVCYIDAQDATTINRVRTEWKEGIDKKEILILPGKRGDFDVVDLPAPNPETFLAPIRYYEDKIFRNLGVPKVILGGSQEYTEASSKVGYLTFEQVYATEQRELEADIKAQLGIIVTFERPISLKEPVQGSEEANTGQVGFQPNETLPTLGRNE